MKATDVANELRKVVAAMEANPEVDVPAVYVLFGSPNKEQFKNVARMLPRPIKKSRLREDSADPEIEIEYRSKALRAWISIPQSKTCRLVSPAIPAKYECDPVLSPEEDAEFAMETV